MKAGVEGMQTRELAEDEELSALLDGELAPDRATELRARMAEEPALSERFARMAEIDQALRGLSRPALSPERLEQLRTGVLERGARRSGGARSRHSWRWIPAAAALAAGLALYLAMGGDPSTEEPLPTPRGDGSRQIAETAIRSEPSEPTAAEATGAEARPEDVQLASLSEEELAIGLAYETLTDLEVIENLELLELMAALDMQELEVQETELPDAGGERG